MKESTDRVSLVRRMIANEEKAGNILSPNFVSHKPWDIAAAKGEGIDFFEYEKVFPDGKLSVRDIIEDPEHDKVVVRWNLQGTWTEPFAGIKPTGNEINISGITIYRFEGDRVVEGWGEFDLASLGQQAVGGLNSAACQQLGELASRPIERFNRVSLVRRMIANEERAGDILSPNFVSHKPWDIAAAKGEGINFFEYEKVFPDGKLSVRDIIEDAEHDKVVVRWNLQGTWTEPFAGIKPTGNEINISGVTIYRFEGDRVAESWGEFDLASLGQQAVGGLNSAACQQLGELASRPIERFN